MPGTHARQIKAPPGAVAVADWHRRSVRLLGHNRQHTGEGLAAGGGQVEALRDDSADELPAPIRDRPVCSVDLGVDPQPRLGLLPWRRAASPASRPRASRQERRLPSMRCQRTATLSRAPPRGKRFLVLGGPRSIPVES